MKTKRIFSILLCLCMALTLLPTAALAAGAGYVQVGRVVLEHDQYTTDGQTRATSVPSDHYAYFSTAGGVDTLTLKNFSYSSSAENYGILAHGDLTLELEGASSVVARIDGVGAFGSLTVTGNGSLSATGDRNGIKTSPGNHLIVDGVEVVGIVDDADGNDANGTNGVTTDSITVKNGGKLTGTSSGSNGVIANRITISDSSELNGTSTGADESAFGVFARVSIAVSDSGKLTGISTNGAGVYADERITVSDSGNLKGMSTNAWGIWVGQVIFNGGKVTATGDIAISNDANNSTGRGAPDLSGSVVYVVTADTDVSGAGAVPYVEANFASYKYFHIEPVPSYTMDFKTNASLSWIDSKNPVREDCSGTGWSWVANDKQLTLNSLQFTTTAGTGIRLPDGAKLVLTR